MMPNVPNLPGVPALSSYSPLAVVGLAIADAIDLLAGTLAPQWGLFLNGEPVVICDSVNSFDYRNSSTVSDYPIEDGGFVSYDKVQTPYDVKFRFVSGGSISNREALLSSILAIKDDTNLYDAVTPERVFTSCNIVHVDFRRTNTNGCGLMVVDVWAEEIRITAEASFTNAPTTNTATGGSGSTGSGGAATAPVTPITNPQTPSAASPINGGTVQTTAPTQNEVNWEDQIPII